MASDVENIRVVVSLDTDDPTVTESLKQEISLISPHVFICMGTSASKIDAINRDMPDPSQFDILLLMSDDMMPQVLGYDQIIRDAMQRHYPNKDGVLFFNDGYQGKNLNTIVICGSNYYKRFGYIYYPGYKSLFCDNEFMDKAYKLRRQTYFDHIIIRHEHPITNAHVELDALYIKNDQSVAEDYALYLKRKNLFAWSYSHRLPKY